MSDYQGLVTKDWIKKAAEEIWEDSHIDPSNETEAYARKRGINFMAEVIARNVQPSPDEQRSQVQSFGGPRPKTWADYRKGCLDTYGGGYRSDDGKLAAFHHGIETVFNLLEAEFPPAEQCKSEARPVQQPATEPDERAQYEKWLESLPQCSDGCDGDLIGLDHGENCPLKGIGFATHWDAWQARAALALRDVPQGPDDREIVAEWRSCLCAAWASGHRAVMTMLLERGPSYPARSVPVGPTKEEK